MIFDKRKIFYNRTKAVNAHLRIVHGNYGLGLALATVLGPTRQQLTSDWFKKILR